MMRTGLSIYLEAAHRVRGQWLRYLSTHIVAAALATLALWPLLVLISERLVRLSGSSSLSDLQIARFFVSPVGLAVLLAMATALITVVVFETAAMMVIDMAERRGTRTRPLPALRFILARIPVILRFGINLVLRLLVYALPALAVMALTGWYLLTAHDINYYLARHPPEFKVAVGLIGLTTLIAAFFIVRQLIRWSLALSLTLFARVSPRAAFGHSEFIVRTRRPGVTGAMIVWGAASFLTATGVSAVLYFVADLVVPEIDGSTRTQAVALLGMSILWILANALLQAFNNATLALSLNILLARGSPDLIAEVASPDRSEDPDSPVGWIGAGITAVLAGAGLLGSLPYFAERIDIPETVEIIAHRAGAAKAPENTMAAVEQAIADGADWLEIDVQEIADGTVVVIHDRDFMRQAGEPIDVHRATLDDIARLDMGSWFGPEFSSQRTPTLEELLRASKGRVRVLIELKYYGHAVRLEQSVADVVDATGMEDSVAFMSLDHAGARRMKALRPEWRVGILTARAIGDLTTTGADFLAVSTGMAKRPLVRRARALDQSVYPWTVNGRDRMSDMLAIGVDGLITDLPALARAVLAEREQLDPLPKMALRLGDRLGVTD